MDNTQNTSTDATAVSTGSLFSRIVNDAKAAKKDLNAEITERATKRKFASAYDSAESLKDQAQINYNKVISNLDSFDVNALVQAKATIQDAADAQDLIAETFEELFGEPFKA
jgi:hypothetical protein